jgi:preprotein translocase subunit SecG
MTTLLLIIHLIIAVALVGVVLLQRSEGGALGIGGGGGGGGFMSRRGTANVLTRTTVVLASGFFATSIALSIFSERTEPGSVIDALPAGESEVPLPEDDPFGLDALNDDSVPVPDEVPAQPAEPAVPLPEDPPATPVPEPQETPGGE